MTIKELRKICQGSEKAPSLASQTLYGRFSRIFSIYFTWVFIKLPFTPNHITVAGSAVFLLGCGLFAFNRFDLNITGWLLIVLAFILDGVDGELARYRNVMKKYDIGGAYVEPVSHDMQYGFMFLPLGIGASIAVGNFLPLVGAFLATTAKLQFRLLEFRLGAVTRHMDERDGKVYGYTQGKSTPTTWSYFFYRNVFAVTGMIPLILVATLLRHIDWLMYFYGIALPLIWAYLFFRHVNRIWKTAKERGY